MQTILNIDKHLLSQAEQFAKQQHTDLNHLVERLLRHYLNQELPKSTVSLPMSGYGGLVSGVDGLSNKSMYEAADSDS
ncbi:MAG: hypothetical protein KDI39_05165 [Pseudomonadales bacterium]|nr:hypothetical protein [Pseudomonadales bacterium]